MRKPKHSSLRGRRKIRSISKYHSDKYSCDLKIVNDSVHSKVKYSYRYLSNSR